MIDHVHAPVIKGSARTCPYEVEVVQKLYAQTHSGADMPALRYLKLSVTDLGENYRHTRVIRMGERQIVERPMKPVDQYCLSK